MLQIANIRLNFFVYVCNYVHNMALLISPLALKYQSFQSLNYEITKVDCDLIFSNLHTLIFSFEGQEHLNYAELYTDNLYTQTD